MTQHDATTPVSPDFDWAEAMEKEMSKHDEWTPCRKRPVIVHVRKQREGETHVSTREGITPVRPDDLIMRGVQGEEYPIGRELFEQTYDIVTEPAAQGELTQQEVNDLNAAVDFPFGDEVFIKEPAAQDINVCPGGGGLADNGFDRCYPPNPYYCTKCEAAEESAARELAQPSPDPKDAPVACGPMPEPVAWCVVFNDSRMGRIPSNCGHNKQAVEAIASGKLGLSVEALYLHADMERVCRERDMWKESSIRDARRIDELSADKNAQQREWSNAYDIGVKAKHELAAAQATNEKLREALDFILDCLANDLDKNLIVEEATQALALPNDTSALNEAKAKVLEDAAEWFDDGYENSAANTTARQLRRMAERIKREGK